MVRGYVKKELQAMTLASEGEISFGLFRFYSMVGAKIQSISGQSSPLNGMGKGLFSNAVSNDWYQGHVN
jgi:hypothetical protein